MPASRPPAITERDIFIADALMRCDGEVAPLREALLACLTAIDIERLAYRLGKSVDLLVAERAMARVRIAALLGNFS